MSKTLDLLPFYDEWLTFWGGDTLKQNHHHDTTSQKYAFDFIMTDNKGNFFRTDGKTCEDYFSFGQDILAPADGVVVETVNGLRDNKPSELNSFNYIGNYIMLQHNKETFIILGHLRQNSILVKAKQKVKAGEKLAECGNSGYSTDPHLHLHVQNSSIFAKIDKDYKRVDVAKGCKVAFRAIQVHSKGKSDNRNEYSPIKGDVVSNTKESSNGK